MAQLFCGSAEINLLRVQGAALHPQHNFFEMVRSTISKKLKIYQML